MTRLAFAQYVEIAAHNWSTLKHARTSMLHYAHARANPRKDTRTFAVGRAVHTAILEPDLFPLHYAVYDGPKSGKGSRTAKQEYVAANASRTVLDQADYERALAMRDAVRSHPLAAPYLLKGKAEQSIQWTDPVTHMKCKARLDWISESKPAIVDLKTSATIQTARFGAIAARLGYHCQSAFYSDGHTIVNRLRAPLPFVFLVVENEPPFDVAEFVVDPDDAMYLGQQEYRALLERVAECESVNVWPGQYSAPQHLELPRWAYPETDDSELTAVVLEEEHASG